MLWGNILSLVGAGMQVYGMMKGGDDAEDAAERNAALYEQQAQLQEYSTVVQLAKHGQEVNKLKGTQAVGYAKAGVTMEGTPTNVLADTAYQGAIDAAIIRREGELKAQIARMGGTAQLERGADISRASNINAAGTLLTQLGKWMN